MVWNGNLDAFLDQVRSSKVPAGPDFERALGSVPDEEALIFGSRLEADLLSERNVHGFITYELVPGVPIEPQILSVEDVRLWDAANKKLKAVRAWRRRRLAI